VKPFVVFVAVLLAAALAACAADEPPTYNIQGTAVNAVTGEVVRRANIHLEGMQSRTVTADASGHFSFDTLALGTYYLFADKPGFAAEGRKPVSVPPGVDDVRIELAPLGHISGVVNDENGDPVLNANIQVFRSAVMSGRRQTANMMGGITNDNGEFRIASLPAGRYFVAASARPEADGTIYPRVFYGGSDDVVGAAPIELQPGGEMKVTIALQPKRGYAVRGKIVNLDAATRPFISLVRKGTSFAANEARSGQINAATGEFEFRSITPGAYTAAASSMGPRTQLSASAEVVVSDGDVGGVTLALAEIPEIAGVVRIDPPDGSDIGSVSIAARTAVDGVQPSMGGQLRPDGTFSIGGLQPGSYFLAVRVNEPRYVKSVKLGGQEIGNNAFTISSAGVSGSFEVVVGTGGGILEGTVTDGNAPVPDSWVLVLGAGIQQATRTDSAGFFHIAALSPGDYTAYALVNLSDFEYMNPDVVRRASGSRISVVAGVNQRIELKLDRTVY
jgi:Carboxypeptidase regulatory-like domain